MSLNGEEEFQRSNVRRICEKPFLNSDKKVRDHDHLVPLNNYRDDLQTVFLCPYDISMSLNGEEEFQRSNVGRICEKPFLNSDKKVRDHDHLVPLNNYRGAAHEGCNISFKDNHTIPVILHNLSGYDAHFIIKDLLPITKEKYIAFTKNIHDSLVSFRFIVSFKFMNSSLDRLSSYLTEYPILKSECLQYSEEHIKFSTNKGLYPYGFTDSFDKFIYPHLPSQGDFFNRLEGKNISNGISACSICMGFI
nr:unnamed protein product [Callosobruchus analis]